MGWMNPSHTTEAFLFALDIFKRYGLDRYIRRVSLTIDGEYLWTPLYPSEDVPPTWVLKRQLDVKINGDMRNWKETEQEFWRPDTLCGYLADGMFGPRPTHGPIFWYPYTPIKAGIQKANHALVVIATENALHEACEMAALRDFPKWNIRDDQETMAEQFWNAVTEHPAWPHRYRGDNLPTAEVVFDFHPEPIKLDISF